MVTIKNKKMKNIWKQKENGRMRRGGACRAALLAGLCVAVTLTGCKSSESSYKKAYDKAKAQEEAEAQTQETDTNVNTVTPIVETAADQVRVEDNSDNVEVRRENVSVVNGDGLKAYSVVVGSFSVLANAEGRQKVLQSQGYAAQIVKNTEGNTYRVVASTFANKTDAVASRNQLRATYSDAWLLYNVE